MFTKAIAIVSLVVVTLVASIIVSSISAADASQRWHSPHGYEDVSAHESPLAPLYTHLRWFDDVKTPFLSEERSGQTTFVSFWIPQLPNTSAPKATDCDGPVQCAAMTVFGSAPGQINPFAVKLP